MTDFHTAEWHTHAIAEEAAEAVNSSDDGGACPQRLEYLEGTSECAFLLDGCWRFTYLNRRAEQEIAQDRDVLGCVIWDVFPEARGTTFEDNYQRAMRERVSLRFEATFSCLSATYNVNVSPLSNGGIGVWFTINEHKEVARDLAVTTERYRLAARATNDLIWDWELSNGAVQWNEALGERLGYRFADLGTTAEWWLSCVHPDERDRVAREIHEAIDGKTDHFVSEYRFLRADGSYADIYDRGYVVRDETGCGIRMVGAMQDNTERKRAAEAVRLSEEQFRKTLDHIPQMVWSTRADGYHDYFSRLWYEFTGVEFGSTDGEAWNGLLHPDDQARARKLWRHSLRTGEPYEIHYRLRHFSGEYRWLLGRAWPERGPDDQIIRWYGTCTDIHEGVLSENALQESKSLQQTVLDSSADCIAILSRGGTLEFMNQPGCRAMELASFDDVRGKAWVSFWPEGQQAAAEAAVGEAAAGVPSRFTGFCATAAGTPKWWDVVITPIVDVGGTVARLLCVSRDVTAVRETSEKLKWGSEHDDLTSLPNRRSFQSHLQAATLRAMERGTLLGLLLIDLDHFKNVNDTLGHPAGDHLLKTFADRLRLVVRTHDFVARLGGDEFALILEDVENEAALVAAGRSVIDRLSDPVRFGDRLISGGASAGGAFFPNDASTANELLINADTALYALKADGRGGIKMFHSHMRVEAQRVASQLNLARAALNEISVVPHYQPKVELRTGAIAGFEALMRWKHATTGMQEPDTIAEAFKDFELASKIGELIQNKVFADMARWCRSGISIGHVSINAAPVEFLRDDYADRLLSRVHKHSVPPSLIELEVTEHVFVERNFALVARALAKLKKAGVRISLDDFGTGYSSLSHLRDLPVDVVKIDKSFIQQMMDDDEVAAIVQAVVSLAGSLSLEVVAEGIETADQLNLLKCMGCSYGQGWFFGRPVEGKAVFGLIGRAG